MSGLDRIVEEIHRQAETEANEILIEAKEYCSSFMADEKEKVNREIIEYNKKADSDRTLYEEKVKSGMEFKERNAVLDIRQKCIAECIENAIDKIKNLPDNEYFEFLLKILEKNVQGKNGTMILSNNDIHRMSETFSDKVFDIANKKGGCLEISKEPGQIKDGFVLIYGNIEENCTLDALFATKKEYLRDIANKELFN